MKKISTFIFSFLILLIASNNFYYAQGDEKKFKVVDEAYQVPSDQENSSPTVPENFAEAQQRGENVIAQAPNVFKNLWQETLKQINEFWNTYLRTPALNLWGKIRVFFNSEVEKRRGDVEAEFQREKQEIKQDIKKEVPKVSKNLWERFKDLIR